MIEVSMRDGLYIVALRESILVLTKAEFVQALRRGKWWKRRHTLQARITPAE